MRKEKRQKFSPQHPQFSLWTPNFQTVIKNTWVLQGTYCLVETVISERDIAPAGEQLIILLGFRTTNKNNGQVEVRQIS